MAKGDFGFPKGAEVFDFDFVNIHGVFRGILSPPYFERGILFCNFESGIVGPAQSGPNAFADMDSARTRVRWGPSSIFAGMLSPGWISHSSNHTFTPSACKRSASGRTIALSLVLWLRKTSNRKSSGRGFGYGGGIVCWGGDGAGAQEPDGLCQRAIRL
jgi:hypothetical protein